MDEVGVLEAGARGQRASGARALVEVHEIKLSYTRARGAQRLQGSTSLRRLPGHHEIEARRAPRLKVLSHSEPHGRPDCQAVGREQRDRDLEYLVSNTAACKVDGYMCERMGCSVGVEQSQFTWWTEWHPPY